MPSRFHNPVVKLMTEPASPEFSSTVVPGSHRQRFTVEVIFYRSVAEVDECLATPLSGQRVVLYGGEGPLPPKLLDQSGVRVVRLAGVHPLKASVMAHAGLGEGDTLTVLLPGDWNGPPAEVLLEHARRWFSSPHSSEDDVHFG